MLAQYRDLLVEGKSVVIEAAAEDRPEGVSLRINKVQPLDDVASQVQKTLRIYLRDPKPLPAVSTQLNTKGEGQVSFIVVKEQGQGEVEISLPDGYKFDPRVAAAMRAIPGVVEVELV